MLQLLDTLTISTSRFDGSSVEIRIDGALTVHHSWKVREALVALPATALSIDLRGVTAMDPAGLAAITTAIAGRRRRNLAVTVRLPDSAEARRTIEAVGVLRLIATVQ